ncbi:hypothetical protein RDWZM_010277 [Blomia tropicalis]|uniref:Sestrin n=1 Tax=Blomia tropicalis TaxID=40697 RepID=A0A9Q0M1P8_BLOTA|nr:hypothetical protein RDWZM_010277 [Blomia tropicalis]
MIRQQQQQNQKINQSMILMHNQNVNHQHHHNHQHHQTRHQQKMQQDDFLERTLSEYLKSHPTYMIPLLRAHNFILRDLGPLNFATRHYIAIMAAARHRCSYLIDFSRKEFLMNGGDPEWLKGLTFAPEKLRNLDEVNKILAHQPWLFKKAHIESLTKGPSPWTLSELTQAIVLMGHFHMLCSLAFGCKFGFAEPENCEEDENDYEEVEIEELRMDANGSQRIKKIVKRSPASRLIVERCRQLELENANLAEFVNFKIGGNGGGGNNGNSGSMMKNTKTKGKRNKSTNDIIDTKSSSSSSSTTTTTTNRSRSIEPSQRTMVVVAPNLSVSSTSSTSNHSLSSTESADENNQNIKQPTPPPQQQQQQSQPQSTTNNNEATFMENTWPEDEWKRQQYDRFVNGATFGYIDFANRNRSSEVSTFRVQDYQWEDQGFSLSNLLYPDIGKFLDEKFKVGYNLTYYTLGPKTNIDTSPFRRAIWNYIQCIYGARHDDYNYREVNILLERNLKTYIKCLACFPQNSVKFDFSTVMKGFRPSEKIHVIIMVAEARMQTELLYALRTVTEYMKDR